MNFNLAHGGYSTKLCWGSCCHKSRVKLITKQEAVLQDKFYVSESPD